MAPQDHPTQLRPSHWWHTRIGRNILLATGIVLLLLAPVVGILPGPGGIFLVAGGAALILRASPWAKRVYVRAKRRWPRIGSYLDRGLRRTSARRRRERDALADSPP
jgi:hypothetical protein